MDKKNCGDGWEELGKLTRMGPKEQKAAGSGGTPARLDSLSSRRGGRGGAGPSAGTRGKFIPKAVARRSKAERDATAPAEKAEVKEVKRENNHPRGGGGRGGRGGRGRGRGRFEPVATAAVGPLAAPSAAMNDRRSYTPAVEGRTSFSPGPGYDLSQFKMKSETPGVESSDGTPMPDGTLRVDMSSNEVQTDANLSQYFPVRLDRVEPEADDELIVAPPDSSSAIKKEKEQTTADGIKIKDEPTDDDPEPAPAPAPAKPSAYVSPLEEKERKRLEADHEAITNEFNIKASLDDDSRARALEQKLYFFQFPAVLPNFTKPAPPPRKDDNGEDVVMLDDDEDDPDALPEGFVGKLRLHKSGKLTMKLGKIEMDVSQGTESAFLQDVVVTDKDDKKSYLIGQISRKMVVAPDVNKLLSKSNQ